MSWIWSYVGKYPTIKIVTLGHEITVSGWGVQAGRYRWTVRGVNDPYDECAFGYRKDWKDARREALMLVTARKKEVK